MNDIERIYSLLLRSNGLKLRAISNELELDKYYVAEIMFSSDNISYWYQDDDSLWFAKEGALQIEEPEEEKDELIAPAELPQKFNINRFLDEELSDSLRAYLNQISKYRIYSNDEMVELFKRYRSGDQKAFDMIIKSQQRLVANIAFLYCRKGAPLEDLIQEGNVGLVKAAERFDYTQFRSFSNYAKTWIMQSISFAMTSMPYMMKLPLNQLSLYRKVRNFKDYYEQENGYPPSINDIEINVSLDLERIKYLDGLPYNLKSLMHLSDNMDTFESRTNAIEDSINKNEDQFTVKKLLNRLQNRERQLLQMFYGINRKEESLASIGDYFGLTRERARQIKEKTVKILRDILYNGNAKDYKVLEMPDESDDNIDEKTNKIPKLHQKKKKNIEKYTDSERSFIIQKELKRLSNRKKSEITPMDVNIDENLNDSNKDTKEAKLGDIIEYDTKLCIVLEKKVIKDSRRIIVKYEDGTIDNLQNDRNRYRIVNYRRIANNAKNNHSKTERNENQKFQLSTPLSDLHALNILTGKQLHQCQKKGLRCIGDVKYIIEKYDLTPDSTRFTKYTLDMWFNIINLIKE